MSNFLAVGYSETPFIRAYDTAAWEPLFADDALGDCRYLDILPDASVTAFCVRQGSTNAFSLLLYDTATWSRLPDPEGLPDPYGAGKKPFTFSPDGALLLVVTALQPYVHMRKTSDWSVATNIDHDRQPTVIAFSPDGETLVMNTGGNATGRLGLYRTSDGALYQTIDVPWFDVTHGAFSPDGTLFVLLANTSPYLYAYRTSDWTRLVVPSAPPREARTAAFSPDGSLLAVAHALAPRVTVYRTGDWIKLPSLEGLPSQAHDVAFSPDGVFLAVGTNAGLYLYETSTWSRMPSPDGSLTLDVYAVEFSRAAPPSFWTNFLRAWEV